MTGTKADRQKIIEKVGKIFALAGNNPSEAEAALAMEMAQKILEREGLTVEEIRAGSTGTEMGTENVMEKIRFQQWEEYLLAGIGAAFDCNPFEATKRRPGVYGACSKYHTLRLFGYKQDVEVATFIYKYLHEVIEKLTREHVEEMKRKFKVRGLKWNLAVSTGHNKSFKLGCTLRIIERVKEQRKARLDVEPGTMALVSLKQEKVNAEIKKAVPDMRPADKNDPRDKNNDNISGYSYEAGMKKADGISLNKAINANAGNKAEIA